ncbi:MAG TPA: hypothetical protein PLD22_07025 [Bacillota bacterium]|jgi:low affinity Fe/Cu permease|nr:hypothetical protein [Bacillota bacterium]HPZ59698.1 hypothetical protein [Bacillota bacterium]HQC83060.1 hypothetical protein [Bacillota bacterium]
MIGAALNFWIYMFVVLVGAKLLGFAEDTKMLVIVVAVSILIYFGIRRFLSKR